MRHISVAERRARLGRRHHLAPATKAKDVVDLARDLVGLHSSDPASVFLAAAARLRDPRRAIADLEIALYEDRALVRVLGMRRTMFVVPVDLVPVRAGGAAPMRLVPAERTAPRRRCSRSRASPRDGARWLRGVERATLAELERQGEATGAELAKAVPGLDASSSFGEGKTWAGNVGVSTRVLFLLSTEQRIVRGRPKGSWTSSQYRWAPMERVAAERRPGRSPPPTPAPSWCAAGWQRSVRRRPPT